MNEPTKDDPPRDKKKAGGQPGNNNSVRHGLLSGKLPPKLAYVEKRTNALRRQLEALVEAKRGDISIVDAAAINSICKWERHACLALHWLRTEEETLSASDRLKFSEAIAKASDARDRSIAKLKLDDEPQSPWSTYVIGDK